MKTWVVCCFFFGAGVLGFFSFPLLEEVQGLRDMNRELKTELKEKIDQKTQLKALQKEFAGQIQGIQARIPFTPEQENFIRDLQTIARQSGFTFSTIKFSQGQKAEINAPHITANLSLQGPRNNVKNLLTLIEQNERFLGMDNLNLQTIDRNGQKISNLSLFIYALYQD